MAILNVPTISVGKLVDRLSLYYSKAILSGMDLKKLRSICLWGVPGIGKSESIEQIAEKIRKNIKEKMEERKIEVRELRLSNCSLIDLIGVLSPDEKKENTVWLKPDIFKEPEESDTVVLIFFDELDKAAPSVQAAALQLILDKKAFVHNLPANSIVIAAGNPDNVDSEMRSKFKQELNNRFRHYFVEPDFESWKTWALENRVHPYVIEYLTYDASKLYCQSNDDAEETAFPTPRSWKAVSDYMNLMLDDAEDIEELYHDISGDIGIGDAIEFQNWIRLFGKLPSVGDIFNGRTTDYPKSHDTLYSLIHAMTTYIEEKEKEITLTNLENACSYASKFPADFAALFFTSVLEINDMRLKLAQVRSFQVWLQKQKGG